MKTTAEQRSNYRNYIIESIEAGGLADKKEKVHFLRKTFNAEYGWEINRIGEFKALKSWLPGLPSALDIVFSNSDILNLAVKMGSLAEDATEKEEDRIIENYFDFMANHIYELFNALEKKNTKYFN